MNVLAILGQLIALLLAFSTSSSVSEYRLRFSDYFSRRIFATHFKEYRFADYFQEYKSCRCQIRLWIDLDANLLAKAEVLVQSQFSSGETIHYEYQQVFTGFNQDIQVMPPRILGMGAIPGMELWQVPLS